MYSLNSNSGANFLADAEPLNSTTIQVRNAQQDFFEECFGPISLNNLSSSAEIAHSVSMNIFRALRDTRVSIDAQGLRSLLSNAIDERMRDITPGDYRINAGSMNNSEQRIQAAVEAVFKTIPHDVFDAYTRLKIPAKPRITEGAESHNTVELSGINLQGHARDIRIDLNTPFWKREDYRHRDDLVNALEGQRLMVIGLTEHVTSLLPVPHLRDRARLTRTEAEAIADATFDTITTPQKRGTLTERVPADTRQVELEVDIAKIADQRLDSSSPFPGLLISQLDQTQLATLLLTRDALTSNYKYWSLIVKAPNTINPTNLQNGNTLAVIFANRLFNEMRTWQLCRRLFNHNFLGTVTSTFAPPGLENKRISDLSKSQVRDLLHYRVPHTTSTTPSYPNPRPDERLYFNLLTNNTIVSPTAAQIDNITNSITQYWGEWQDTKETVTLTGEVEVKIKSDELLSANTGADAPLPLQNRPVAGLRYSELVQLLSHPGANGDFPHWKAYVEAGGKNPTDQTSDTTPMPFAERAVRHIYNTMQPGTAYDANRIIGQTNTTLLELHKEIRLEHGESMKLVGKLSQGSQNTVGARAAAHVALNDPEILRKVQGGGDTKKLKEEIAGMKARMNIGVLLKKLRELTFSPSMKESLDVLQKERDALRTDLQAIGISTRATSWSSNFATQGNVLPNSPADLTGANSPGVNRDSERRDAQNKITGQLKLVSDEIAKYEKTTDVLIRIFIESQKAKLEEKMSAYIDNNKVDPSKLTAEETPIQIAEKLEKEFALESDDTLTEKIKKKEVELQAIEKGGDSGDALQLRIMTEKFKKDGLSEKQAEDCAKQFLAQGYINNELKDASEQVIDGMFNDDLDDGEGSTITERATDWWNNTEGMANNAIERIITMLRIDRGFEMIRNDWMSDPTYHYRNQWRRASYRDLITAYYALKELYEGKGGDAVKGLEDSSIIRREMANIAKVLTEKHTERMMKEFSFNVTEDEQKKIGDMRPVLIEKMQELLTGDTPAAYKARVERITKQVNKREAQSGWNMTKSVTRGIAKAIWTPHVKVAQLGKKAAIETGKFTWANKGAIAGLATCALLAGPIGLAAYGMMKAA